MRLHITIRHINAKLLGRLAFKFFDHVDAWGALSDVQPSYIYPDEFLLSVQKSNTPTIIKSEYIIQEKSYLIPKIGNLAALSHCN
jgi:hypothetical protein